MNTFLKLFSQRMCNLHYKECIVIQRLFTTHLSFGLHIYVHITIPLIRTNPSPSYYYYYWYYYYRGIYHRATGQHDAEAIDGARRADHPRQSDEQNDAEDVLHARQVHADQGAHSGRAHFCVGRLRVGVRRARNGVRVVGDRVEKRGHPRPVLHFVLKAKKIIKT